MYIYEWSDFCPDWKSGLAIVIAENRSDARDILWEQCCNNGLDYDYVHKEIYDKDPVQYSLQEIAFYVTGGS